MTAALSARVSTHGQQTLPIQVSAMKEYVRKLGWEVEMCIEDTVSGVKDQEKREQIILAAKRREIDIIVVWKLDRWGRSIVDLMSSLEELTTLQVGFASMREAIELTTPAGKALAGMLAVFAQFGREMILERVKAGIAHARAHGKPHGRPKTAALKEEQIKELFSQGYSKAKIARELGIGRTSVRRLLNPRDI
ncbi:MAG: recombinase family protein [Bacteroidota bacterium]